MKKSLIEKIDTKRMAELFYEHREKVGTDNNWSICVDKKMDVDIYFHQDDFSSVILEINLYSFYEIRDDEDIVEFEDFLIDDVLPQLEMKCDRCADETMEG